MLMASEAEETTSSSSSSTQDLSSYSVGQLAEKLNSGEITQAQYNQEIERMDDVIYEVLLLQSV